jgi:hypothetical protein
VSLSAKVVNNSGDSLSITSNGLDGEGLIIDSFNITPTKFFNIKIPFVVKIKDSNWFSVKTFDSIDLGDINVSVVRNGGLPTYSISSLNYTLSSQNHGGAFRGYVEFKSPTDTLFENLKIVASGTFSNGVSSFTLSGESSYFNVVPLDYYDIYKKNENFVASNTLRDITFQESIMTNDVLYNDFFGGILGNESYDHESIGTKTYEKISNFTSNTQDVDTCGIDFLESISQFCNYNTKNEEKYMFPEKIKRLIDLGSISKTKLFGTTNKFRENLDVRGHTTKEKYGKNIGSQLNTMSYIVSAGTDIVAMEKFSNTYKVLNTWQPVSAVEMTIYPLSGYNSDWGWPLVLPSEFSFEDMEKYYLFFNYNNEYDNTVMGGVIDFDNEKTTVSINLSSSEIYNPNGLFDKMFLSTLYRSLSIVQ